MGGWYSPSSPRLMKRIVLGLALVLSAAAVLLSPSALATSAGPEPSWNPHADFRLIFSVSFTGKSLGSSWNPGWFGTGITSPVNGNEEDNYSSAHVRVSDGTLDLTLSHTASTTGGVTRNWTGALVDTNGQFSMTYGRVEVRAYIPGNGKLVWDWPSILLNGQQWPEDGEIDLAEGLAGRLADHMHSGDSDGLGATIPGSASGWHTFGLYWSSQTVQFFYDGHRAGQITQGVPDAPEYIIIDNSLGDGGPAHPSTLKVAWVRAWSS